MFGICDYPLHYIVSITIYQRINWYTREWFIYCLVIYYFHITISYLINIQTDNKMQMIIYIYKYVDAVGTGWEVVGLKLY
jgi:hypothetical protein